MQAKPNFTYHLDFVKFGFFGLKRDLGIQSSLGGVEHGYPESN